MGGCAKKQRDAGQDGGTLTLLFVEQLWSLYHFQPPDLLATIMTRCEEYFREAMPKADAEGSAGQEPWSENWRSGIEGIDGL